MKDSALPTPEMANYSSLTDDILRAMSDMPITEFLDIRNQICPHEYVSFTEEGDFPVYKIADMEAWRKAEGILFTTTFSEDSDEPVVEYIRDGIESTHAFSSEREALIFAFEQAL
jgi:hypothetical protein